MPRFHVFKVRRFFNPFFFSFQKGPLKKTPPLLLIMKKCHTFQGWAHFLGLVCQKKIRRFSEKNSASDRRITSSCRSKFCLCSCEYCSSAGAKNDIFAVCEFHRVYPKGNEKTYPTRREKENHLQKCLVGGIC